MKFVLLSQAFYDKYSECKEILKKKTVCIYQKISILCKLRLCNILRM